MAQMDKEYVLRTVKEQQVRFIRLWFTDVLGFLKSFAITVDELETALEEGMGFDGSSIEGFARIEESDMIAKPDPNTFAILPWRPSVAGRSTWPPSSPSACPSPSSRISHFIARNSQFSALSLLPSGSIRKAR